MSAISPVPVPSVKDRIFTLTKLFPLNPRVRAISGQGNLNPEIRVGTWIRTWFLASGRKVTDDLKKEMKAWERIKDDNELPSDLLKGLCGMYLGLRQEMLVAKSEDEFIELIRPRYDGYHACAQAIGFYEKSRSELHALMHRYYRAKNSNPELAVVTAPGWIPDKPILIAGSRGSEPKFQFETDAERSPRRPKVPDLDEAFHEVRQSLSLKSEMTNGETYRPLQVEVTQAGLRLTCGPGFYFDYQDSCEILGAELAGWMLKNPGLVPNPNGTDLPLRKQVEDIFNLRNRCAVLGVSTLLIAVDGNRKGKYFWHERSQEVAVNPGSRSVVPSGTFQPFSANLGSHPGDFNITSTVLREFAEELLGADDFNDAAKHPMSVRDCEQLRPFLSQLDEGRATIHFLGIGIDPVTTVPEVLTAMVFRGDLLMRSVLEDFTPNFEGTFGTTPLSVEALQYFARLPNVHSASAACASLVAKHYDYLLSSPNKSRAA